MDPKLPSTMPRWVKLTGAGAIALLLAFIIYHLAGHGFHHHH